LLVYKLSWEEAVEWLRGQADQQPLVRACYFDDPLVDAAERFRVSEEWNAVRTYLPRERGRALDIGAGRGISSYALAHDGWYVTAIEPDPGRVIGAQAIGALAKQSGLPIRVIQAHAEAVPFSGHSFDLIHARQVLHHAASLNGLCHEVARLLKPGGLFIATREHVISKQEDLSSFLQSHPLHRFYGGENAFLLADYLKAIQGSGLKIRKVLGPFDSIINYFPMTYSEWRTFCMRPVATVTGHHIAQMLTDDNHRMGRWLLQCSSRLLSLMSNTPGRLYTFVASAAG
jgi:SAM-dependent methyltransferase